MNAKATAYLTSVSIIGLYILLAKVFSLDLDLGKLWIALIFFSIVTFFAEVYELEVIPRWSLTTGIAMTMSAIYIGEANLALWVILLGSLPAEIIIRWNRIRQNGFANFLLFIFFNVGQLAISVWIASWVFIQLGGATPPYDSLNDLFALSLTFLVYEVSNASLVSGGVSFISGKRFTYILQYSLKYLHIHFFTLGVIAIVISIVYAAAPINLIFAFIPLALAHYSMRNYLSLRRDLHIAFSNISDLLERRDEYTRKHSDQVAIFAEQLARELHLSDEQIESIKMGAAIHDIGKIAVPDSILRKEGPLTKTEWEIMKQHPIVGSNLIRDLEIYREIVPLVLHEHEHWNGDGYPKGLSGQDIPLGARIIAIADVYSALTTERQYRPSQGKPLKYTHIEACNIMKTEMAGKVLDPTLVDIFISKVKRN